MEATDRGLAAHLAAELPPAVRRVAAWTAAERADAAERCADVIASGGDALWARDRASRDGGRRAGELHDGLVTGLAVLAHRHGGVRFAGMEWDAALPGCAAALLPGTWSVPAPTISREDRGAVFTPREIADDVVSNALGVLVADRQASGALEIESLRVADIACGSGAFLVAAARYLADVLVSAWKDDPEDQAATLGRYGTTEPAAAARAFVIEHCIYGVDVDPLSVELAGVALQLLAPTHRPPGGRLPGLRVGDALVGGAPDAPRPRLTSPSAARPLHWSQAFPDVFSVEPGAIPGFAAIVGNPPFLGANKLAGALGEAYREHLVHAVADRQRGRADLAVYFWLRAHQLVHRYGVVALVAPVNLLRGTNARVGRDHLARRNWRTYREILNLKWPTTTAAIACCLVWTHFLADPQEPFRNVPERW